MTTYGSSKTPQITTIKMLTNIVIHDVKWNERKKFKLMVKYDYQRGWNKTLAIFGQVKRCKMVNFSERHQATFMPTNQMDV